MGAATAEDSHSRIAQVAARTRALLSIVNVYTDLIDAWCIAIGRCGSLCHPSQGADPFEKDVQGRRQDAIKISSGFMCAGGNGSQRARPQV